MRTVAAVLCGDRDLIPEFIREEMKVYNETQFPDQLFDIIYKIYGLPRKADARNWPQFFGKFIRKYVYEPLENSHGAIFEMLNKKNLVVCVNRGRRYKMFNFMSDVIGMPALKSHLWQVFGIGNSVKGKTQFERAFHTTFPQSKDKPG
jgi:hypothetical protein